MKVTLIDCTGMGHPNKDRAIDLLIYTKSTRLNMTPGLLEEISAWPFHKKMDELAYMARTIPSSWEFVDYTFLIEGVTRAFTHQLVRTRTASFAQQTMRVLNVDGWRHLTGPSIAKNHDLQDIYDCGMADIADRYVWLINSGAAIEDARGILPTNIETNIVMKCNMRTLVEMVRKRSSSRTQGEYRDVLDAIKAAVLEVHPWIDMFISREKDKVIAELEKAIIDSGADNTQRISMIKLLDELRKEG